MGHTPGTPQASSGSSLNSGRMESRPNRAIVAQLQWSNWSGITGRSSPLASISQNVMKSIAACLFLLSLLHKPVVANESWWQFLGPEGTGYASNSDPPTRWSEQENVAWKTAIHGRGWSSPVIHGDQVWLTTASEDGHQMYAVCLNKQTGEVIHDKLVFEVANPQKISFENTYATPTPVVTEDRVFVHFGTYGTACLDCKSGKTIWSRQDLTCDHETNAGPASSPTIVSQQLIFHVDGRDVQYIIALDLESGNTLWKTERSFDYDTVPIHHRKAYSMPGLAPTADGRQQLISVAAQGVYSYDLDGTERWFVRHKGWSIFPRPISGHDMAFVVVDRDHPELWAIRHDGQGDVTESHVAWKETRGVPARTTPLLVNDLIYMVNREGVMSCLDALSGELVWKQRMPGQYSAGPLYVPGSKRLPQDKNNEARIYLFNEDAQCTIIRPSRKFSRLANNQLNEQVLRASPAVDGDVLYIRTEGYLYRIEQGAKPSKPPVPQSEFVGKWEIGKTATKPEGNFLMTLRADGTASKSHVPSSTGRWQVVNGEARVVWSEGWRDIIRPDGEGYRKIAFRPGTDFDSQPSNIETAVKQSASQ